MSLETIVLIILTCGSVLVLIGVWLQKRANLIHQAGKPVPGPAPWKVQLPLMTNLADFQFSTLSTFGSISATTFLSKPALICAEPELIKELMVDRWEEFGRFDASSLESLKEMIEDSLFILEGEEWKKTRQKLREGFKYASLKFMVNDIISVEQELAQNWKKIISKSSSGSAELEICDSLTRLTTEIIGLTGFGLKFNSLADSSNPGLFPYINRVMSESTNVLAYIPYYSHLPTPGNNMMKKSVREIVNATNEVIQMRLKEDNPPQDLLQVMLSHSANQPDFTPKEVLVNAMGFLIAGSETTSIALTWTLYELGNHPDIQKKLRQEVLDVLDGQDLTWDHIGQMKYLNFIVKESVRLYPPAWINVRTTKHPMTLGDIHLPTNAIIMLPILALHRHKPFWGERASEFIPERWDPARSDEFPQPARGAYIPFNIGPRDCIGARFAQMEMKIVLTLLIQQFQFAPAKGFSPTFGMSETLKPKHGMKLLVSNLSE